MIEPGIALAAPSTASRNSPSVSGPRMKGITLSPILSSANPCRIDQNVSAAALTVLSFRVAQFSATKASKRKWKLFATWINAGSRGVFSGQQIRYEHQSKQLRPSRREGKIRARSRDEPRGRGRLPGDRGVRRALEMLESVGGDCRQQRAPIREMPVRCRTRNLQRRRQVAQRQRLKADRLDLFGRRRQQCPPQIPVMITRARPNSRSPGFSDVVAAHITSAM